MRDRDPVPNSKNDIVLSYTGVVQSTSLNIGNGVDLGTSYFIRQHLSLKGEADLVNVNAWALREYGFRAGPVFRWSQAGRTQPYAQILVGYARVKATYFGPTCPYKGGFSLLGGAGADFHIQGPLFVRIGADYVGQYATPDTEFLRGTVGLVYRFGGRIL